MNDLYEIYDANKPFEIFSEIKKEVLTPILPNFHGNFSAGNTNIRKYFQNNLPSNTAEISCKISNYLLKGSLYALNSEKAKFIHYTSLENCLNIINEGRIRLYSVNYLQDPNEYIYLNKLFKNPHNDFTEQIRKKMHVFSMCEYIDENSEEFDLWRLYGINGNGVALIFEIDNENLNYWESTCIGKVDYNPDHEKLTCLNEKYNSIISKISNEYDTECEEAFSLIKLLSKKSFYNSEKEVRIIKRATNGEFLSDFEKNRIEGNVLNSKFEESSFTTIYLNNLKDINRIIKNDLDSKYKETTITTADEKSFTYEEFELFKYPRITLKKIILGYHIKNSALKALDEIVYRKQKNEFGIVAPEWININFSKFYKDFN